MNKKTLIFSLIFFILFTILTIKMIDAKTKYANYTNTSKKLNELLLLNKDLDFFAKDKLSYNNYDDIEVIISNVERINLYLYQRNFVDKKIKKELKILKRSMLDKIAYINNLKSINSALNISFKYLQVLHEKSKIYKNNSVYTKILTIEYNKSLNIDELVKEINVLSSDNEFTVHANNFVKYYKKHLIIEDKLIKLNSIAKILSFIESYDSYIKNVKSNMFITLMSVIIFLLIFLIVFINYSNNIINKQNESNKFKRAVNYSDNIIYITDLNKKITYVNKAFEASSGLKFADIIGKSPSFLKSHNLLDSTYENLNKTIYSGKVWKGEFEKQHENADSTYEKVSISPIFNKKGKIVEFLSLKLDITDEKLREMKKNKEKDIISHRSKMSAIGEMLESISHQWKQPLSAISTAASGMKLKKEYDSLSDDEIYEFSNLIISRTDYLSKILSDFSDVFNKDSNIVLFNIPNTVNKVLELLEYRLKKFNVIVIKNIENIEFSGLENELMQVFVSMFNNAIDVLEKVEGDKYIFITVALKNNKIEIKIKDNANGVEEGVQSSIFDPYFTTKHESQGTGLGLYISYDIILKHFNGNITMNNAKYKYNNMDYVGAEFLITIPHSS